MDDSSRENDTRPAEPLRKWERTAALVIGIVFSVLAVIALFTNTNQAGTAAMLVVAAAFLLIGVQGTALVRFGGGATSLELDRRVAKVVQRADEVAETNPQQALGILEGAAIIEPRVGPAAGAFQAMSYENEVRRALERVRPDGTTVLAAHPPADFVIQGAAGRALVAVVFRRSRSVQMIDLAPLVSTRQLEDTLGGLMITNEKTTSSVADYIATATKQGVMIEVVTWNGPGDDTDLAQALSRLLTPMNTAES